MTIPRRTRRSGSRAALAAALVLRTLPAAAQSGVLQNDVSASQCVFNGTGNTVYSLVASSGISVGGGSVVAPYFAGSGAKLTGVTGQGSVLNRVTADTSVANTTTETTLFTYSVPGGTLSTDQEVVLNAHLLASFLNAVTLTLRVKYGATTLATLTETSASTLASLRASLQVRLSADGATGAQVGHVMMNQFILNGSVNAAGGTASEDSTAAKNLVITAQWSAANASDTITLQQAILHKP